MMKNRLRIFAALFQASALWVVSLAGCSNDDTDRPETIKKLRALGVEQAPTITKPGDVVSLTFYLAGPQGLSITTTPLQDAAARYGRPVLVTAVDNSPVETPVGPLSLYKYQASFTTPSDDASRAAIAASGFARLRYKVKFQSSAGDEESVVGDTLLYPPGAPQLEWKPPTISITTPAENTTSGKINLEGAITATGNENNRVAWFVSSGKVINRKARKTTWEDSTDGLQALFFTVRGAKSGAFAIKSQVVTIN